MAERRSNAESLVKRTQSSSPTSVGIMMSSDHDINNNSSRSLDSSYGNNKPDTSNVYSTKTENRAAFLLCSAMTIMACLIFRYRSLPYGGYGVGGDGDDTIPVHPLVHHKSVHKYVKRLGHYPPKKIKTTKRDTAIASTTNSNENTVWTCQSMLEFVVNNKIQLVALDFDKTILDVHTGGRWKHRSQELVPHVRPEFVCLIQQLLEQEDMQVAVATFSTQKDLIRRVLQKALAAAAADATTTTTRNPVPVTEASITDSTAVASKSSASITSNTATAMEIPVFGGDDWVRGHTKGKQSQLLLAMEHFNTQHDLEQEEEEEEEDGNNNGEQQDDTTTMITPTATLLIDDDAKNIHIAQKDGYWTILYGPSRTQ